ncbi:hypothetical protein DX914_15040 [Lysobacter silvisoli]|uniref:Uncharacterized protein n=2 Tax=Lysobacter silvisoli TaxID=2293254 RepID=A0A371K0W0_9GAMM|nr:hypothetical protein DX914_15040 [Lysobacter silvisoli]
MEGFDLVLYFTNTPDHTAKATDMNVLVSLFSTHLPRPRNRDQVAALAARPQPRERAFGVGYGSSSGYGLAPAYVPSQTAQRFR